MKEILNIAEKTMRGSESKKEGVLHVVSTLSTEEEICFGQKVLKDKSKKIVEYIGNQEASVREV